MIKGTRQVSRDVRICPYASESWSSSSRVFIENKEKLQQTSVHIGGTHKKASKKVLDTQKPHT